MVAKVNSGKNILGLLNYNENKVKEGAAACINENMFSCNVQRLSFYDKLNTFRAFTSRNLRATTNAVHISLNFDPSEKLNKDILNAIATQYMDKIGFGNQPYLVYQHFDAAHPHIHIVTTNIQRDGKRIILYNIGRNQSEKARKEIERDFGLVKAQGRKRTESEIVNLVDVKRAVYGKTETKRTISNAVRFVIRNYRYTSIPELNAVLKQYNVMADTGNEGSQMHEKKGLLYRLIDEQGKKVGVGIKSSSIYGKPTQAYLEKQFKLNEMLRRPHRQRLINCIEQVFAKRQAIPKATFIQSLSKEGIYVLFRQNDEGRIYGLTFVDNKTKVVFNGSDLGKPYGAKALTERLTGLSKPDSAPMSPAFINAPDEKADTKDTSFGEVLSDLTTARQFDFSNPDAAMRRKKRKKKKGRSI
jgi:hypothetical protein